MAQPFTTLQIQQKLEENHDLLTKIVASQQGQLDPSLQPSLEGWSATLQQNLMDLAGQADKPAAQAGQQQTGESQAPVLTPGAAAVAPAAPAQLMHNPQAAWGR